MRERDFVTYSHDGGYSPDGLEDRPLTELVSGVGRDMGMLVRQEIQLAKVEIGEKMSRVAHGAVSVGIGAVIAFAGALAVVAALVLVAIAIGITAWLASAIIGVLLLVGGYGAINAGKRSITSGPPPLQRTTATAKETVVHLKEQLR